MNLVLSLTLLPVALAQSDSSGGSASSPAVSSSPAQPATKPNSTQAGHPVTAPIKSTTAKGTQVRTMVQPARYQPDRFAGRAGTYYRLVWGVDTLSVKWTESGEMIRFAYRVLDKDKAKTLNDEKSEPSLIDPKAGVSLVVPAMENVGKLRQSNEVEEGKSYWMAFSNKGRLVKRGDRVNVVIGKFRAEGLVVD